MYTLYKFHFLNGISEINQLFDDILIIWPAPVYVYIQCFPHIDFTWAGRPGILTAAQVYLAKHFCFYYYYHLLHFFLIRPR